MTDNSVLKKTIGDLLAEQNFGVWATHSEGQPYTSLMAFAATDDLREILFATDRNTHKFSNILADSRVSFMVDSRSNSEADLQDAVALTICGKAEECEEQTRGDWMRIFLQKHPSMREFIESPSCALLRLRVSSYYLVSRFQEGAELIMED